MPKATLNLSRFDLCNRTLKLVIIGDKSLKRYAWSIAVLVLFSGLTSKLCAQNVLKATVSAEEYRVGDRYKPPSHVTGEWVRIPKWQAGTWSFEDRTITVEGRAAKQAIRGETTFGSQFDAKGDVWHLVRLGFPFEASTNDTIEVQINDAVQNEIEKDAVRVHHASTHVVYLKSDGKIVSTGKDESDDIYRPVPNECLWWHSDMLKKIGAQNVSVGLDSIMRRVSPVAVDPKTTASFCQWLRAHSLENLVPGKKIENVRE
jgi:hypothetical protein